MSIVDFIAVVSFGLTCFSIGYTFGKEQTVEPKYLEKYQAASAAILFFIRFLWFSYIFWKCF